MKNLYLLLSILGSSIFMFAQTEECDDPMISSFIINTDSTLASYNKDCCPVSGTETFVQLEDTAGISSLYYSTSYVFINSTSLAYFTMGSWATALTPEAQELTFKLPRVITEDVSGDVNTAASGTIGVAVDGVAIFSETTSKSYDTSEGDDLGGTGDGYWNQDAWVNEAYSMDATGAGHSNAVGTYHYHATPVALYTEIENGHSPIVGWGLDGVPIYGPYGYDDPNDSGSEVVRIESSYVLRNITERTTLPSGEVLDAEFYGPDVAETGDYTIGWYVEDYEYDETEGHLDEHNGRWCKTPEYPDGVYAYFVTIDIAGSPQYPYFIGPEFYGETITAGGGYAKISSDAELFDPELCDEEELCALAETPVITATQDKICDGDTTTLSLIGNFNDASEWVWYTESCDGEEIGRGVSIDVNPTINTTYYVHGEGVCGNGACANSEVTLLNSPSIDLGSDVTICTGNDVIIEAVAVGAVTWDHGDAGKTITVSPLSNTNYIATATLMNGCSVEDTIVVNVDSKIEVETDENVTFCSPNADNTQDTITVNGSINAMSSIVWTTAGSGVFTDDSKLKVLYTMSTDDISNGSVVLTLSSTENACGISTSEVVIIVDPCMITALGLNDDVTSSITVFPNPIKEELTVSFTGSVTNFNIIDLLGNVVYQTSAIVADKEIITFDAPSGIYYLCATIDGELFIKKLVKK